MFILTVAGKENDGAYSVTDDDGNQILYLFEEEDDAVRYALLLESTEYPEMHVLEVEDEVMIKRVKYTIITIQSLLQMIL